MQGVAPPEAWNRHSLKINFSGPHGRAIFALVVDQAVRTCRDIAIQGVAHPEQTSVVLPVSIGLYWWANTYQSIHYVLVCIWFVFEVRWFVLRTTMVAFGLEYILYTIQIQTVDSEISSHWTSHSNTILTNTEMGRTIQTKTLFNPNQSVPIQCNTHQYIVNGLVCIEYKLFVFNTYCLYSISIAVNPYLY